MLKMLQISLLLFCMVFAEAQWCTKIVQEQKERQVLRTKNVLKTKMGWFNHVNSYWVPHTYVDTEPYTVYKPIRVCCDGYTRDDRDNCIAVCTHDCPTNSYCVRPERCECKLGYLQKNGDCAPFCLFDCPLHSICSAPETCSCVEGYTKDTLGGNCEPLCETTCGEHSFCAEPSKCLCEPGYERLEADAECSPSCTPACGAHSYCSTPHKCDCEDGYAPAQNASLERDCVPLCSEACGEHSTCNQPDHCECDNGYKMSTMPGVCEPVCTQGCPLRSHCERPDECLCENGYILRASVEAISAHCEPQCHQDCGVFGKCAMPDVCECLAGYEMQQVPNATEPTCMPVCSDGCVHGHCHQPGICVCDPGFLMGPQNQCEPVCSLGCIKGNCTAPEICSCAERYRFVENSTHECEPICEPGCVHANCVAPNICLCWLDYEPLASADNLPGHICRPNCQPSCVNATCTAPNVCSCDKGHERLMQSPEVCVPKCSQCKLADCIAPEMCQIITTTDAGITSTETADTQTTAETEEPALLTMTTSSTAIDYLLLPAQNCSTLCKCWQEQDDLRLDDTPKCMHICLDAHDQPCLELSYCRCIADRLELICNESVHHTAASYEDSVEENIAHYSCAVRSAAQNRKEALNKNEHYSNLQKTSEQHNFWPLLLGYLGALTLLALSLYMGVHYFVIRHRSGRFVPINEPLEQEENL